MGGRLTPAQVTKVPSRLNYVAGRWKESSSGEVFTTMNPANQKIVARAQKSNIEDCKDAIDAAENAFYGTGWSKDAVRRSKALYKLAQAIRAEVEELAKWNTLERGKIFRDSLNEVLAAAEMVEYYAGLARNVFGRSTVFSPESLGILLREPVGVVGVIAPWNAPILLLMRALAPSLAAGNTNVVKPSSYTPSATAEIMRLIGSIQEFQEGVVNMVTGPGEAVGTELARSKKVDMVSLTGDTSTGKQVMKLASNNLKRLSLELGGKSPNIIFPDADMEKAIKGAVRGACFSAAGQICFAGTRVLVHREAQEQLTRKMKEILPMMRMGDTFDKGTDIGPVISEKQLERVMKYVEVGKREAKLLVGGDRATSGELSKGFFVSPTVFYDVPPNSRLAKEEVFGPLVSLISFNDEEEALEIANNTVYGLAAAVWTKDIKRGVSFAMNVRAGTVWINGYGRLPESAEQGGYKQSGVGRLGGLEGLNHFTEIKHINIDVS